MATVQEVAQWLLEEIYDHELVFQTAAVKRIAAEFGEEFLYLNKNGNLSISRDVLGEFRRIRGDDIEWNDGERSWRLIER